MIYPCCKLQWWGEAEKKEARREAGSLYDDNFAPIAAGQDCFYTCQPSLRD